MVRWTIGAKLISVIAFILISSLFSVVWVATRLFIDADTALIQQANADLSSGLAAQMRLLLGSMSEKMRWMASHKAEGSLSGFLENSVSKEEWVALLVVSQNPFDIQPLWVAPQEKNLQGLSQEQWRNLLQKKALLEASSLFLERKVQVSSFYWEEHQAWPWFVMAQPWIAAKDDVGHLSHFLVGVVKLEPWIQSFAESNALTSFIVNERGRLLVHSDSEWSHHSEAFQALEIVKQWRKGAFHNGQTRYWDPLSQKMKLGAFHAVGVAGLAVIAEVEEARAFEAAKKVESRSLWVAWVTLCIAFWIGYLYAHTLTAPIRVLVEATRNISKGNFKTIIQPKSHDEIGELSLAFNDMAKGLEERDRVKATFSKFHQKEVAEKILSGDLKLGGERKVGTVFFSDVRGFTSLSESLEPEQVVELLNEYMTRMVSVIQLYGGVVDKYVGDAIMALWGVPVACQQDSLLAVQACLAMRQELSDLNALRLSRQQPVLKIGMGLNRGPLIAGNIGSVERMEYTVIGDTVNLASRIEAMTKEYGTDLLISESVYQEVKDHFLLEHSDAKRVKGKSQVIEVYQVLGYFDDFGVPVLVETPYSHYPPEKSDKVVQESDRQDQEGNVLE